MGGPRGDMGGPPGGLDVASTYIPIPEDLPLAPGVTSGKGKTPPVGETTGTPGEETGKTKKKATGETKKKTKEKTKGKTKKDVEPVASTGPVDPKSQLGELINALGDIFGNDTPFGKAVRVRLEKVLGQPLSPAKAMSGGSDSHRRVKYGTRAVSLLESTGRCSLSPDELEQFRRYYRKIRHA